VSAGNDYGDSCMKSPASTPEAYVLVYTVSLDGYQLLCLIILTQCDCGGCWWWWLQSNFLKYRNLCGYICSCKMIH